MMKESVCEEREVAGAGSRLQDGGKASAGLN